jgi:tetratricopeptide (TPR) repeat protein
VSYETLKTEGNAHVTAQRYAAAVPLYSKCIALEPAQPAAYGNRALCHLKMGQFALAKADAEVALRSDPGSVKMRFRLAQAQAGLGETAAAITELQACLLREPGNAAIKTQLDTLVQQQAQQQQQKQQQADVKPGIIELPDETPAAAAPKLPVKTPVVSTAPQKEKPSVPSTPTKPASDVPVTPVASPAVNKSAAVSPASTATAVEKAAAAASKAVAASPAKPVSSATDFMQQLVRYLTDPARLAFFITSVPAAKLKPFFANRLEARHLTAIVPALATYSPPEVAVAYLRALASVDRFAMVKMFLVEKDQQALAQVLSDKLKSHPDAAGLDALYFPWV